MDLIHEAQSTVSYLENAEYRMANEDDNSELPPSDIVAYNELRSCADLYRLYSSQQLDIQPEFQREIVWNPEDQTRFIDSLIKQLPIPSLCISLDYRDDKRLVIDGLQRISSIIGFLDERKDWKLANTDDIDLRIAGKYVSEIKRDNPALFRRVQNATLPITILRCNYSKQNHMNYLFTIFHRLNSGGARLNNQEIRNAIYGGALNLLLKELNTNQNWQTIAGIDSDKSYRFLKEELILRFFAFFERQSDYTGRLAMFLNKYMFENKQPNAFILNNKRQLFLRTVNVIFDKMTSGDALSKTSISVVEAVLIGVAKNIDFLENIEAHEIQIRFASLMASAPFSEENLRAGLSGKDKVNERLNMSKIIFSPQNQ